MIAMGPALLVVPSLLIVCVAAEAAAHPELLSVLFFLADDLGFANVDWHAPPGASFNATPHMNALLADGVELDRFYTYKYCSPTRSSLLSGRLPFHVNEGNGPITAAGAGIPADFTTLSERLSARNWSCHQIGKWHCGFSSPNLTPQGRGFATSLGFFSAEEDHYSQVTLGGSQADAETCYTELGGHPAVDFWRTDRPASDLNGTDYSGSIYTREAMRLVSEHDVSRKFLLYFAFQNNHVPLQVPPNYISRFAAQAAKEGWAPTRTNYTAMTSFVDETVGNVTTAWRRKVGEEGWKKTLVIFTGDNGGDECGSNNFPLRGNKFTNWDGGTRVAAFVAGGLLPEHARGGRRESGLIHVVDWYNTILTLAGIQEPQHDERAMAAGLPPPDSLNVWPLISGKNSTSPRTGFVMSANGLKHLQNITNGQALIDWPYKLLTGHQQTATWSSEISPNTTGPGKAPGYAICGIVPKQYVLDCGLGCVYNLEEDPEERVNLNGSAPLLHRLLAKLEQELLTTFKQPAGPHDPAACTQAARNGGFVGPWRSV